MGCSDSDYDYLRQLVLSRTANLIDPARNAHFEMRLKPVAKAAGASNLEGLVSILRTDQPAHLHRAVAEAMTINETSFFRDRRTFDVLRDTILPRLIETNSAERRLRMWSAAGSTGQEAYSLAMLLCEHFPACASWDVKIVGTDISQQVIDVCPARPLSPAGGQSRTAGAHAGEVPGARRRGVGGGAQAAIDVRFPACESVCAAAQAADV